MEEAECSTWLSCKPYGWGLAPSALRPPPTSRLPQVRIKLKHMEIEIRRRETTGIGAAAKNESETIAKYEIMDGAPARGEVIPIRSACGRPLSSSPTLEALGGGRLVLMACQILSLPILKA